MDYLNHQEQAQGHKGDTLTQTQIPDKIELHKLEHCPSCSS